MTFWGVFFMVNWSRHQRGLNILWDDYANKNNEEMHIRRQFRGVPRISPVTDKPDTHFSFVQRLPLFAVSFAVCIPCLAACICVIICFLNMTGVIRPEHHGGMFDIPYLSSLANPGAIFDPLGSMNMVAAAIQAVTTIVINLGFRRVAVWTAEFENHKTQRQFEYSVFIKRFIFEFTDFQLYLFYIGIYQMHLGLLKNNLIGLFCVDEFRRILCESIIPYFMQNKDQISHQLKKKLTKAHDTTNKSLEIKQEIVEEEMKELERDEIELFDDYLEMIMTYGYITLFASAFPLGATITCAFIYIEIRSDIFKLEFNARRPIAKKTHDIGTWMFALNCLTYGSIFTNLVLSCFASD